MLTGQAKTDELVKTHSKPPALLRPEWEDCNNCNAMKYDQRTGLSCPRGKWPTSIKSVFIANINPNADCIEP